MSYFVSMVGINEKIIKECVKIQENEDTEDKRSLNFESTTHVKGHEYLVRLVWVIAWQ